MRTDGRPRARADVHTILSPKSPTVALTRLQSAIGTLHIDAACSPDIGDLGIGCLYQLSDGESSTVQLLGGARSAPRGGTRPILLASKEQFQRISVDLRGARHLDRLAVYAFSVTRQPLRWAGTLVTTTYGGARVEAPIEMAPSPTAVLMTVFNINGEFILRSEMESFNAPIRDLARAYGYDRITWQDQETPVA